MFGKQKTAALVAEFLGTGVLTLLIYSVAHSQIALAFFIAMAAGLTLAMVTFVFGGVSGGHFNPAITLAAWTARQIDAITAVVYIAVQMLGAYLAYYLFKYLINAPLANVKTHYNGRILVAEAVGTGIFALGWSAASVYNRVSLAGGAAITGLSYMVGIVSAASLAGIAFLNPAVALGVRSWAWGTYVLGPVLGAVIGVNLYQYLFAATGVAKTRVAAVAAPAKAGPKRKTTAKRKTRK